jgi:aspartate/methionine/tyrosine aminotransferase
MSSFEAEADAASYLEPFSLEHYFAKHEFSAKYLLCSSDVETMTMKELLDLAKDDEQIMEMWGNLALGYTETKGHPVLRQEIANGYESASVASDNVLCFAGAEEGIYCTMKALLFPRGDQQLQQHAVVVTPCYQSLRTIVQSVCDVSFVDLEEDETRGWTLDVAKLRSSIRHGQTKMIIMNFPHNPTGGLISHDELAEIVELAREHDCWLFFDEVYRGIEQSHEDQLPTAACLYHKAISLGVVSKALGLAGLRIGWIACQDIATLERIAALKHYLSICNSGPSEILALIALRYQRSILQRNRSIVQYNMGLIDTFLVKYGHIFSWTRPRAGCTGFMKFSPNPESSVGITLDAFASILVESFGVLILPGCHYSGYPSELDISNHFRFGFGRRNFPEALKVFEQAVDQILSAEK